MSAVDTCSVRTTGSAENCNAGHDCAECGHYEVTVLCGECGGALVRTIEITHAHPWGTGYELLVCEECDAEIERRFLGF